MSEREEDSEFYELMAQQRTIKSLRKQVAELSTDWQVQHAKVMELEKECSKLRHEEVRLRNQGIEKNARIAELREAFDLIYSWANNWDSEFMNDPDWKNVDFPKIQDIVTRTDDTSALEAFRNSVIDECIGTFDHNFVEGEGAWIFNTIKGLKR